MVVPHTHEPASPAADSDARDVERLRLVQRRRRIEQVVVALRTRHRERSLEGPVPEALSQAIAGFTEELVRLGVALSSLGRPAAVRDVHVMDSGKART